MGKKKKPWINKRASTSYKLVYRGQDDPLSKEPGAPQMVLAPLAGAGRDSDSDGSDLSEDQFEEQRREGIYFTDEYDYMQHLKPSSEKCPLQISVPLTKETVLPLDLPPEVFPSKFLLPPLPPFDPFSETGPEFIDKEIQAALEGELDCSDPSSQLEDDFVRQANEVPEDEMFCGEYGATPGQWRDLLGDYNPWEKPASAERDEHHDADKQSKMTDCSMTSSSVHRNEGMQLLDAQFEQLMEEYEEGLVGQGGEDMLAVDEVAGRGDKLLEQVVLQFKQTRFEDAKSYSLSGKHLSALRVDGTESSSESDIDSQLDAMLSPAREREQWDCESVLSTYSNLYNHPTEIPLPPPLHRKQKPVKEDAGSADDVTSVSLGRGGGRVHARSKGESSEERRERKVAVRAERREARERKKEMKHIYKAEKINAKLRDTSVPMVSVV